MSNPKQALAEWAVAKINATAAPFVVVTALGTPEDFDTIAHGLPSAGVVVLQDSVVQSELTPPGEDIIEVRFDVVMAAQAFTSEQGLQDHDDGLYDLWWIVVQALTRQIPTDFDFPVEYVGTSLLDIGEGRIEQVMEFATWRQVQW